ncbi:hypothetical protein [Alteromonas sp. KUL49]|uniref:hypothetical protein n=1 Tax=Alteromonas sp. KUL49 TaxID=2480798 RepID=UPI00102F2BC4|nr:hypothetical protein [Alteromonas sp. KUL49]TAP41298.1 hypothetical protein EYS00_03650 [Alteromonas sp. KUL49]GEA10357.1 hypothetical protein KUL49_07320 [Alteromonas sp. KUL49]
MKSILFFSLFLFSVFEVHASRLVLLTKVLSQEVVKRDIDGGENPRLKPFKLEQSNACGIQFVKLYVESVLDGHYDEKVIDTHVILGEWCGQPFDPCQEYVVKLFDKKDPIVSIHRTQLEGWEVFNLYSIERLPNNERALIKDWHIEHFDHLTPSVISNFDGKSVIKIDDLRAWYTTNKPH